MEAVADVASSVSVERGCGLGVWLKYPTHAAVTPRAASGRTYPRLGILKTLKFIENRGLEVGRVSVT